MDFSLFLLFVVFFPLGLVRSVDIRLSSGYFFKKVVDCPSSASNICLESSSLNVMDPQSSQQHVCCDGVYSLPFSLTRAM